MAVNVKRGEDDRLAARHLDKIGVVGSLFAALCCLGFPALVSILSAIGLGFLINDAILIPLLLVFLAASLVGLAFGVRHHHRPWALVLGAASAIVLFVAIAIRPSGLLAGIGIAGQIGASLLNVWLRSGQLRARR
jgi:mercuric ion transport protein